MMSNELREFTAEEMRGCPPFKSECKEDFWYNTIFEWSDGEAMAYKQVDDSGNYTSMGCHPMLNPFKCNPIDRCHAIARHLFELMPIIKISKFLNGYVVVDYCGYDMQLSINPFLHTDITEITREELGL